MYGLKGAGKIRLLTRLGFDRLTLLRCNMPFAEFLASGFAGKFL
jgi:hypothetical protein